LYRSVDVSLWHIADQFEQVSLRPLMTDAVDKVGDEQGAGNNRIQVPRFLNQCCASDSYLESMLLTRPSKKRFSTASTHSGHSGQALRASGARGHPFAF